MSKTVKDIKDDMAKESVLKRIRELLDENPGIVVYEIAKKLNMSYPTLQKILNEEKKPDFIKLLKLLGLSGIGIGFMSEDGMKGLEGAVKKIFDREELIGFSIMGGIGWKVLRGMDEEDRDTFFQFIDSRGGQWVAIAAAIYLIAPFLLGMIYEILLTLITIIKEGVGEVTKSVGSVANSVAKSTASIAAKPHPGNYLGLVFRAWLNGVLGIV